MSTTDPVQAWKNRIVAVLDDPHCRDEGPYGGSPLERLVDDIAKCPSAEEIAAFDSILAGVVEEGRYSDSFYENLTSLIALSGRPKFTSLTNRRECFLSLHRVLESAPTSEISRRAAAVSVIVNVSDESPSVVINPKFLALISDLEKARPRVWLNAAGRCRDSVWVRSLFEQRIPEMLKDGRLTGADIATRLGYWMVTLSGSQSHILESARRYLNFPIDEKQKKPILTWFNRNGYETNTIKIDKNSKPDIKISQASIGDENKKYIQAENIASHLIH